MTITAVAILGDAVIQLVILPPELADRMRWAGALITAMLALPISFYVGTKLREVSELTMQLEQAAERDLLTGAGTRLSFYRHVEQQGRAPMVVIVTDIDHFKAINDRFGHQGGDLALRHFAGTLVRNCREEDIVARFGGEEFVILLHNAGMEEGLAAANRLCQRVREKHYVIDGARLRLTASFGVAELNAPEKVDVAIHHADMAVYRAKQGGRDRVCAFDPVLDRQGCPPSPEGPRVQVRPISAASKG